MHEYAMDGGSRRQPADSRGTDEVRRLADIRLDMASRNTAEDGLNAIAELLCQARRSTVERNRLAGYNMLSRD